MVDSLPMPGDMSVQGQLRRARWFGIFQVLCLLGITGLLALLSATSGPQASLIGWIFYLIGVVAIFFQPRYGVYLIVGLAMIADRSLIGWYPFVKNFSSVESLFFVHDSLIISPMELYIALTFVSWWGQALIQRKPIAFFTGPLFWPAFAFIGMVTFGLIRGLTTRGDLVIALWESRAIFYLPAILVLTSNLVQTRAQLKLLILYAALGLVVKSIAGVWVVATELSFAIGSVERIAEHAMSIQFNALIVSAFAAWVFRISAAKRLALLGIMPMILLAHLANNRRASFIGLGVALFLIFLILYKERRKLFAVLAPPTLVLSLLYLAAFWNVDSGLGLPASAIRSVIGEPDARDESSNLYRIYENMNIMFTIKTSPLTGVGFGNKFHIIRPMADISSFIWWEYITHNSVLWMWMKLGVFGFLTMLYLIGLSLVLGGRAIRRAPQGDMQVITIVATLYLLMHYVYAYVDMSWDSVSMILVGAMLAVLNSFDEIISRAVPVLPKRWPWQPDPRLDEGLRDPI